MNEKKVLLFIVEGISDEVSFQSILENFFEKSKVKVAVMHGDITTKCKPSEIKSKISYRLTEFCSIYKIHFPEDVIKIIHLVDTDGAYVSDDCIQSKNCKEVEYTEEAIFTSKPEDIKERNSTKSVILNTLSTIKKLNHTSYEIYYFSRNLEHVLHNKSENLTDEDKKKLSEDFDDEYADNLESFLRFIKESDFAVKGDYKESWNFIKQDTNSLKRYSNFHLFFNQKEP